MKRLSRPKELRRPRGRANEAWSGDRGGGSRAHPGASGRLPPGRPSRTTDERDRNSAQCPRRTRPRRASFERGQRLPRAPRQHLGGAMTPSFESWRAAEPLGGLRRTGRPTRSSATEGGAPFAREGRGSCSQPPRVSLAVAWRGDGLSIERDRERRILARSSSRWNESRAFFLLPLAGSALAEEPREAPPKARPLPRPLPSASASPIKVPAPLCLCNAFACDCGPD